MAFLDPNQTALVLAPMEGVMDAPMRALIADLGGFDYGVSEFVRVGQGVVCAQDILRDIPDLKGPIFGSATLPLQLQLLGGLARTDGGYRYRMLYRRSASH